MKVIASVEKYENAGMKFSTQCLPSLLQRVTWAGAVRAGEEPAVQKACAALESDVCRCDLCSLAEVHFLSKVHAPLYNIPPVLSSLGFTATQEAERERGSEGPGRGGEIIYIGRTVRYRACVSAFCTAAHTHINATDGHVQTEAFMLLCVVQVRESYRDKRATLLEERGRARASKQVTRDF